MIKFRDLRTPVREEVGNIIRSETERLHFPKLVVGILYCVYYIANVYRAIWIETNNAE